ncbi:hypothetical protein [Loigolactobacillus binensis]|uniref:Membrane protein 6-pyruvoyl-tetrahydropterin synthase-related domain-containing protein n=1 Tax=Loigolactobacillus binensis TaxID=2559922 RepID=A0ABW3EBD3_9LACO|nr:hypothetical protein [Loigolactobacillus binensis]
MFKRIRWWRVLPYLLIMGMAVLLVAPQVILHSTIVGSDAIFHFNRIYDAAKQIQHFNFSYFQTNYGFQQSGRIINALYGPYFAYLSGVLLILVRSWYHFQIISTLLVYTIGGIGMYRLASQMQATKRIALVAALLFMNVGWLPRWGLSQNLNAWGAALAPFMLLCAVRMISDHQRPVKIIPLALIMAVIIEIHILSTIIFTLVLLPFFVIGLWQTQNKLNMVFKTVLAALLTILLTANIWGSFLTIFANNRIAEPAKFDLEHNALQFSMILGQRNQLGAVCLVLFAAQIIYVLISKKVTSVNRIVTVLGGLILFIASDLFPWVTLQRLFPFLQSTLQFPVRFTIIAYPLLFCGVAISATQLYLNRRGKPLYYQIGALVAVILCLAPNMLGMALKAETYHSVDVLDSWTGVTVLADTPNQIRSSLHAKHPGQLLTLVEKRHPDYLPIPTEFKRLSFKRSDEYEKQIIDTHRKFNHQVLAGGRLRLTWEADRQDYRQVPLIVYKESKLELNGRPLTTAEYDETNIGAPVVPQRIGHNTLILKFKQPSSFTNLLILSLISWSILLGVGLVKWFSKYALRKLVL